MPFSKKRYARRPRKFIRRAVRKPRRVSAIKRMVRKEVARTEEVKSVQYGSTLGTPRAFSTVSATNFNPNGIVYVLPGTFAGTNISVGGQEGQRIGNSVRTKSLVMTAMFYPSPYNVTTNPAPAPSEVVLWMFRLKPNQTDSIATVATIAAGSFFQSNLGNIGMSGQLDDIINPVNPGQISMIAMKRFKLGFSAYGNSGASASQQHFHNNDFKYNHKLTWNVTRHCPKLMSWDDTGATEPSQRKIWIIMQALGADGASTNPLWIDTCRVNFRFDYKYTDA